MLLFSNQSYYKYLSNRFFPNPFSSPHLFSSRSLSLSSSPSLGTLSLSFPPSASLSMFGNPHITNTTFLSALLCPTPCLGILFIQNFSLFLLLYLSLCVWMPDFLHLKTVLNLEFVWRCSSLTGASFLSLPYLQFRGWCSALPSHHCPAVVEMPSSQSWIEFFDSCFFPNITIFTCRHSFPPPDSPPPCLILFQYSFLLFLFIITISYLCLFFSSHTPSFE